MSHCPVRTELHRTFVPRQPKAPGPLPLYKLGSRPTPGITSIHRKPNQATPAAAHHQLRPAAPSSRSIDRTRSQGTKNYLSQSEEMGSCFSSSGSAGDDYGEERRPRRVWPNDDDGGEWDVDNRAAIYIAKFHRHQSGVVCTDCAAADQQQQQTPAAAAAQ